MLLLCLESTFVHADPPGFRRVRFEHDELYKADNFHIVFKRPVNLPALDSQINPGQKVEGASSPGHAQNADFPHKKAMNKGKEYYFWGGSIQGRANHPPGKPGYIEIAIPNDLDPRNIDSWYFTQGGTAAAEGIPGDHYLGYQYIQQLTFSGEPAAGDGRIAVSVAGESAEFTTVPGSTPHESMVAFLEFLRQFIKDGKVIIHAQPTETEPGVAASGTTFGNQDDRLKLDVLQEDSRQIFGFPWPPFFHPGDTNQDGLIDIDELGELARRWREGEVDDIDAVSRAAEIWRNGEHYHYEPEAEKQHRYVPQLPKKAGSFESIYPAKIMDAVQLIGQDWLIWGEDPNHDGNPEFLFIDANLDKTPDRALVDRDADGIAEEQWVDDHGDGLWDRWIRNTDDNDRWDRAEIDVDSDGLVDWEWIDEIPDGVPDQNEVFQTAPTPFNQGPKSSRSLFTYEPYVAMARIEFLLYPPSTLTSAESNPAKVTTEDRNGNGVMDHWFVDDDLDGVLDRVYVDTNEDDRAERMWLNRDDQGPHDIYYLRESLRNGTVRHSAMLDLNLDGLADYRWDDINGDGQLLHAELFELEPQSMPLAPLPES